MARLEVSSDRKHFTRGGEPFFWVGDTVWSAFTNATLEEWDEYLDFRKAQGFNVLQINTLPQWDRVLPDLGIYPYPVKENGALDYTAEPNPEYVTRAQTMCQMAVDRGFVPALVVDWCNMVPNTWLSALQPHVWPLDQVEQHVRRVVEWFDRYEPVYIVSGDTDLKTPETIEYYARTIEILKELAPQSLRTMHLCGEYTELCPELEAGLDFLIYQSGHGMKDWELLEQMPQAFRERFGDKPLLNSEPCYENIPKMGQMDEAGNQLYWTADEVVLACRRSIEAGADAGITYGAMGLWNWNRKEYTDYVAANPATFFYPEPLSWREAMQLPGAGRIAEACAGSGK